MFNFCSLYSGSSGNSLFVQTDNTKILVDAGESAKKIETALNSIDVKINDIDYTVVKRESNLAKPEDYLGQYNSKLGRIYVDADFQSTVNSNPKQKEYIIKLLENIE